MYNVIHGLLWQILPEMNLPFLVSHRSLYKYVDQMALNHQLDVWICITYSICSAGESGRPILVHIKNSTRPSCTSELLQVHLTTRDIIKVRMFLMAHDIMTCIATGLGEDPGTTNETQEEDRGIAGSKDLVFFRPTGGRYFW